MRRFYIYILTFSLLLTACSSEDTESAADSGVAISFSTTMSTATTRAANAIDDNPDLSTQGGFGVFGCYTGLHRYSDSNVRPDFMYNEHVTYNESNRVWEYSPLKYWPNGEGETSDGSVTGENPHYVSFMAYAPWSDTDGTSPDTNPAGYCIPSFSLQGEIGNPWLTYRLIEQAHIAHQVDLLYAKHSDVHPILDLKKPESTNSKVLFDFNHALACVGDKVSIKCSEDMIDQLTERVSSGINNIKVDVTKLEIVYTLTSKARLVLWNQGEANWQTIYSEQPTCTRTVTLVDAENPVVAYSVNNSGITTITDTWNGSGVFYIPIELAAYPQTAQVNLTYCISTYSGSAWVSGIPKEGSATINMKAEYSAAYQPGKHLYINVTINDKTTSFIVTAAIADWALGNGAGGQSVEAI